MLFPWVCNGVPVARGIVHALKLLKYVHVIQCNGAYYYPKLTLFTDNKEQSIFSNNIPEKKELISIIVESFRNCRK